MADTDDSSIPTIPDDQQFVHLHLHSEYSLLDGGNRLDKLVRRIKELGMTSVAVTDHGNLHAAASFYKLAKSEGIKPILGVEAYVAAGDRRDRIHTGVQDGGFHLVLLAETLAGWENLLYLCSEAYRTGFYYKPRMDREILESHADGLIAINGHLGSEIAHHLVEYNKNKGQSHWDAAVECATWHASTFKPNPDGDPRFYVEMQHHVEDQNAINPHLIRLAREMELPLVCDNDSHFLKAEDHDAHDTLICISMGKFKNDSERLRYTPELYVKSPQQMRAIFEAPEYNDDVDNAGKEALDNTVKIAERCNVDLDFDANHAPVVIVKSPDPDTVPKHDDPTYDGDLTAWYKDYCTTFELEPFESEDESAPDEEAVTRACDDALRALCEAGMVWRYGPEILESRERGDEHGARKWARLERELKILADKSISAYFLIVWDFVNWGRQKGIPALARGSGVGTMVGYVLGLSNACPVNYGLLFERFTDPNRSEYPDIDIDLCQFGRGEVIDYVRRKYGHVAQIITFGTLKARAVVRDVGRVHEMPLPEVDKLAKLIPESLGMTLDKALEEEPDLKKLYEVDREVKRLIDVGRTLEGQARHSSIHAAGVIVATRPLDQIVPLYKASGAEDHEIVTQWDGPTCESIGLLKMDFLGLRTLTTIERAKLLIREGLDDEGIYAGVGRQKGDGGPHPLDLDRFTYDDQRVFDTFRRGDTTGVFQFESGGMRRLLTEMKPDRLEDLIAANALFRPGPMDLIPDYNRRKHGEDSVPTVHEIVDKYTAETYGVMIYQEQVMQIVHGLGGIPLRDAYSLIKAISKKKEKVINAQRPKFIEGAGEKGLQKKQADELFELILKFAGYGFNKSHSTGYAIVAYQTAYLKTYFPNQYMAAFLTFESQAQKVSDWVPYLDDCRKTRFPDGSVGVEVRSPDVNLSDADFSVVFDEDEPRDSHHGTVRFGLKALKGAGEKAIDAIITERQENGPYESLFDFCERVPAGVVNKATIEALIKSSAFDNVHTRDERAAMIASIDQAVSAGQKMAKDRAAGQSQLFGAGDDSAAVSTEPAETPLAKADAWTESELLAFEKDVLGFYVSSHPIDRWRNWASVFITARSDVMRDLKQDSRVVLAGLVQSARHIVVRSGRSAGQKMAILTFEDLVGSVEAVLFTDCFLKFSHLVEEDSMVFLLGRIDHSRGDPQVIVERVVPIDGVPLQPGRLCLHVNGRRLNGTGSTALRDIASLLTPAEDATSADRTGTFPVDLVVETEQGRAILETTKRLRVSPTPDLVKSISESLGDSTVRVVKGVWLDGDDRNNNKRQYSKKS